jgi:signal peptidase
MSSSPTAGSWLTYLPPLVVAADLLCAIVLVSTGRWGVSPVLSGSMDPTFPPGSVVISQQAPISAIRTGDVIIFHPPYATNGALVVHRVIVSNRTAAGLEVITKGDANRAADPWGVVRLRGDRAYRARFDIPLVGYAAVWIHSRTGRAVVLALGGGLLLLAGWSLVRGRRMTAPG